MVAIHQSSSVVAMHQSSSAVWYRQWLLMSVEPIPRFPSSLLPQASCSSHPRSQQPHRFDNSEVYGLGIEVHVVPSGKALGCCGKCRNLFLFGGGCIACSSIHKILLCQHLRSIHTGELGTAVLVVCVDECMFELLLLFPAMAACWCMRFRWSRPELPESHLSRCGQLEAACGIGGGESSCFGLFPTTFGSSLSQPSSGCDPHEPATRLSLILSTSTAFTGSTRSTISSSTAALPAVAVWWRSICLFQVSILENLQQ